MKIKTLLVALSTASLLASCGGAKWKSYSYKRQLDTYEKAALLLEARAATLGKISKMESKATVLGKSDLRTLKREIKSSAEFFTKGEGIQEEVTKETEEYQGFIKKFEQTEKGSMVCFDEENHKYATIKEDSLLGTFDYGEEVIPEGYEGYAASEALGDILICYLQVQQPTKTRKVIHFSSSLMKLKLTHQLNGNTIQNSSIHIKKFNIWLVSMKINHSNH